MTRNKQSSVELLAKHLLEEVEVKGDGYGINHIIVLCKAIHKEEHRITYNQGLLSNFQNFEHYYEQTFGGKK